MALTRKTFWLLAIAAILALVVSSPSTDRSDEAVHSVIVQGNGLDEAIAVVRGAGGAVTHELDIIDAVAADLTAAQIAALRAGHPAIRVHDNELAETAGKPAAKSNSKTTKDTRDATAESVPESDLSYEDLLSGVEEWSPEQVEALTRWFLPDTHFPTLIAARSVHDVGIDGSGVTIAVVDSGISSTLIDPDRSGRVVYHYDAIQNVVIDLESYNGTDGSGHGTHVAGVISSVAAAAETGEANAVAPGAGIFAVRAFGADGSGTYADVIRGIQKVIKERNKHGIRVLNLSFSAPTRSHYWDDPVNQAVMKAWQAGIVVVAAAGNSGPDAMTIGVPGNVPYVITVGAMTDSYTPDDPSDDRLTTFSAAGPTTEAFVKPDVLAPGGHVSSLMSPMSAIASAHPEFHDGGFFFEMSGTSQATAVVSGIVALMLQSDPAMGPDDVKCRLMASSHPAVTPEGTLAYSPFQQGSGMVNAYDAIYTGASGCANRGLDIDADLLGKEHFAGYARKAADGSYYIEGLEEQSFLWGESSMWNESFLWSESTLWQESTLWSESFLWGESTLWSESVLWMESTLWMESFLWSESDLTSLDTAARIDVNTWIEQE